MLIINEWQPKYDTQVICGHTVSAGQKACKLTISVCQDDVACLPQAIKAALKAQKQQAQKPSLLYLLWHQCFGTKPKKTSLQRATQERMRQCTAKQEVRLDCGHTARAGSLVWESRLYTCERERSWPLAVLSASLLVLQQKQAVGQPDSGNKTYAAKNVYSYAGYHQPAA